MRKSVFVYTFLTLVLCGLVASNSVLAQPNKRPSERDVQIQKVFIEASKEKLLGNYEDAIFLFNEVLHKDKNNHAALFELAQLYQLIKKEDKAKKKIQEALFQDEENVWYNLFYINILEREGSYSEAAELMHKLRVANPDNEDYYFEEAFYYAKAEKYPKSLEAFEALESLIGLNEEVSHHKYNLYMASGKPDQAEAEIQKLIDRFPKRKSFLLVLADHYRTIGEKEAMEATYKKVLELDPEDPDANLALTETFKQSGNHEEYLHSLQSIFTNPDIDIDIKVKEMVPYIDMVAKGTDQNITNKAIELTEVITKTHPSNAKAFSLHGDMLFNAGFSDKALEQYLQAIELEKNIFTLWQQVFLIYAETGKNEELVNFSEEAMDYFPNQPMVYLFNGIGLGRQEKHDDAIDMLEQALFMCGNNQLLKGEIYVQLGSEYNSVKNFKKSDEAFEKALEINSNNALALNNYSYYLSLRGEQLDKAETMAQKANNLVPNQPAYMDTLGWIFYQQKRYKEAKNWITKAVENGGSNSPEILENLGDVLFQLNEIDEAVKYWSKALELGSDSEMLEKKIADKKLYE